MEASLAECGWTVSAQPFTASGRGLRDPREIGADGEYWTEYRDLPGANLVARYGDGSGPVTAVAAHLDGVAGSPGANDNASGLAALLELARVIPKFDLAAPPLLVALDMEELGGFGARAFFTEHHEEIREVIVLECVAMTHDEPGTQQVPFPFGLVYPRVVSSVRRRGRRADWISVLFRPSSRRLAKSLRAALREAGGPHFAHLLCDPLGRAVIGPVLRVLVPALRNLARSDHSDAWELGIPAVCLTDTANFRDAAYHTSDDLPDRLDYGFLSRVVAGVAAVVAARAERPSPAGRVRGGDARTVP
ncbi:M28 family peptidase [Actinomadura formosensis]|uniref:M28 family peptidase n=1 Tax=Actinomadura formosensis TaxID=60706 RepID=UPI0013F14E42|nr:M28 family peptidase [Actinomadura formosensis]